jgi:Phage integrase family
VFISPDGQAIDPDNFMKRDWARALRRANLRRIRFHDLRHTYASLLIAQGAHPKYIQAQLGHASIQTTLDRYGHLMPQIHEAEARKLDRLVFGSGPILGGVESVMPQASHEADALQRSQNGPRDDDGVSGGNR